MDTSSAPTDLDDAHEPPARPPTEESTPERFYNSYSPTAVSRSYNRNLTSSHQSRHRHSGSREARLKRRLWFARDVALVAIATGVVLSIMLIHFNARLDSLEAENNALASELKRSEGEAKEAKSLLAAQEVELSTQMRQRIPGVSPLELGRFYDIDNRYFHKVSFSESGVGDERRLTYFAVLKNAESDPVTPAASILLFDRQGLQTGVARIAPEAATPATDRKELAPGETRNYTAQVKALREEEPHYFLVELD